MNDYRLAENRIKELEQENQYFASESLKVVDDLKYLNGCVVRGRGSDINTDYMRANVFGYIQELEQQNAKLVKALNDIAAAALKEVQG